MSETEVLHRLSLARAEVMSKAPYVADTLLNLTPVVVDHAVATIGVTRGMVLYVNPKWLMGHEELKSDEELAGVLYHEVEHILRGIDRLEVLPNQEIANYAADIAINDNLLDEGWMLPSTRLTADLYGLEKGHALEWYYEKLVEMCEESQKSIQQLTEELVDSKASGSTGKKKASSQKGKKHSSASQGQKGDGQSDGEGSAGSWKPDIAAGACGGISGNSTCPDLEAELDKDLGKTGAETEAIRRQTLEAIEQHIQSYGIGSTPGRFRDLIKTKIRKSLVDWRSRLRQVFRRTANVIVAGASDYSMRRPSICSSFLGVAIAGLIHRPVQIAVVEDTSGSMGALQLSDARSEGFHLIKKAGVQEFWFIQADVDIHRCERVRLREFTRKDFRGRGGTDFRQVFERVQKLRPRPNLVVYYTDGAGPAPKNPPKGIETIWCIVRSPFVMKPADWGHIVVCDKNQNI